MKLFSKYTLGNIELNNRIVMAPMTRSRAVGNIPNDLMATYYEQRATAGLLITEGVSPSPNGLGYSSIPGIYNKAQVEGWSNVTDAVHKKGGRIFAQFMHTGRVGHPYNLPEGAEVLGPSAIGLTGQMYTNQKGMQPFPVPREMTLQDIETAQDEYVQAAVNAIEAGFDGVELHGANGYLICQFLNTSSNQRTDQYGGSAENRNRFALEVAKKVVDAIGAEKTAIRLSPYGVSNEMAIFEGMEDQYEQLASSLSNLNLVYIHLVDHSSMGAPQVPDSIKSKIRKAFKGTLIVSGGLDKAKAEAALKEDKGDLVAFGKPFISNPDLVYKLKNDLPWSAWDTNTFYAGGEKGYTDYPSAEVKA
ncbi:MAG: alkene reductase [Bacteroidales bacterium]|nr:alkene reductase [Bacteroidales bacterium]